jgi:hypothetical protein
MADLLQRRQRLQMPPWPGNRYCWLNAAPQWSNTDAQNTV